MKDVKNRVPRYPNRKKITYEDGTSIYATMEYADDPMEVGTPIDEALFKSIQGDIYRIDKYTRPTYVSGEKTDTTVQSGEYIGLWGNSHYAKFGITVSASNEDGENYAYRAMNGVEGYWSGNSVPTIATPVLFTVQLNEPIVLKAFKIIGGSENLYCKTFTLQGSVDGDNYYDIMSVSNNTSAEKEYNTNNETYYKYYRLSITESSSSEAYPAILEFNITKWIEMLKYNQITLNGIPLTEYANNQRLLLDIKDTCDELFTNNIFPPMMTTSENGYLIQSSGDYINTSIIDAFDYDDTYTYWRSLETQTERYIMITMPINVVPSRFKIKMANVSNGKIQGSTDGDNWDDLLLNISATDLATLENDVETTKKYRYFRFIFNANVENTSSLIYSFEVTRGYISGFNYSLKTYININSLGDREVDINSIVEEGNYEFVYSANNMKYQAYLNSFSRASVANTFTAAEKAKLAGIEVGAEVNIVDGIKVNGQEVLPDSNRVINLSAIPLEEKGTKNGVATLDNNGKIPNSQLPEIKVNIVTELNASSTDDEVPSAKCVYDLVGDVETLLSQI